MQDDLRDLADDGRTWAHLATVDRVVDFRGTRLLDVTTRPGGRQLQARLAVLGAGDGRGVLVPVVAGDEVLVVCPDGDANSAVALPAVSGKAAPLPNGWDGARIWLLHPGGVEVRQTPADPVQAVVTEDLLGALSDALAEVVAIGAALPVPIVASHAAALQAAIAAGQYRSAALKTS